MASNNPQPNRNHFWTVGILVAVVAGLCGVIALLLLRGGSEAQKEKAASPVAAPREDAYLNELRADLEYLRNNMQAYLENAAELESDPAAADGRTEASGEKDDADADLAAAQKRLDDAKAQYNAILADYNAAAKQIEDSTPAYEEGKARLAQIEPLMPYVTAYVNFQNGVTDSLPGFGSTLFHNAQAWFAAVVLPMAANTGVDLPDNVEDMPAAVQQIVAESKAQMASYEEDLQMLEEDKTKLEEARAQLEQAQLEYDNAAKQKDDAAKPPEGKKDPDVDLADGEKPLALAGYEQKEDEMVRAILKLIATPEVANLLTKDAYLGSSFNPDAPEASLWQKDENGNYIAVNEHKLIDLDACEKVIDAAQEYVDSCEGEGSPWD